MTKQPHIAVVGAGLMGHGIAWIFAAASYQVNIYDQSDVALNNARQGLVDISTLLKRAPNAYKTVHYCSTLVEAVQDADFVFEAVSECLALKRKIFNELALQTKPNAILASNTSALPITQIAADNPAASRIVGTHFWNPPYLIPLVEVISSNEVNDSSIRAVIELLRAVGRHPVHVRKDVPGFVGNRLQHALKREAIALVSNGVCDAATIDDVVKLGFGKRLAVLGPLEQSDLVGLDLTAAIHETLMPDLDRTDGVHPYLLSLIAGGNLGIKTGKGFREWTTESAEALRRSLLDFLATEAIEEEVERS